jgi:hypothetical protein
VACDTETTNHLEGAFVRAGASMAWISRCNDLAMSWAAEGFWLHSWQGQGIFIYPKKSRPVLGPTQLPVQWAPEDLPAGIKRSIWADVYFNV